MSIAKCINQKGELMAFCKDKNNYRMKIIIVGRDNIKPKMATVTI